MAVLDLPLGACAFTGEPFGAPRSAFGQANLIARKRALALERGDRGGVTRDLLVQGGDFRGGLGPSEAELAIELCVLIADLSQLRAQASRPLRPLSALSE